MPIAVSDRDGGAGCFRFFGVEPKEDGEGGEVDGSIVGLHRVGAWMAAVVRCLTERETCGCQLQKLYTETKGITLELSMAQLTGKVQVLMQYWVGMRWRIELVVK